MIAYRPYPLVKPLVVNGRKFEKLIISSHYEERHSSYMTDEIIKAIVQQLNGKNFFPKLQGQLPENPNEEWQSFFWEPFLHGGKPYRLVWYWESNQNCLWVLNCFKNKKYEKK